MHTFVCAFASGGRWSRENRIGSLRSSPPGAKKTLVTVQKVQLEKKKWFGKASEEIADMNC